MTSKLAAAGFRKLADIPGVSHLPPFFGFCAACKDYTMQHYYKPPTPGPLVVACECGALDPRDAARLNQERV